MISFTIKATTEQGSATATFDDLSSATQTVDGFRFAVGGGQPCPVTVTPPASQRLVRISYLLSTHLRNFHQVIVPDTGRGYPGQMQLVDFWARNYQSRINNIRMPLFILTGQDMYSGLAFGVIGENYESDFIVREPAKERALVAWMKRLTLEIARGTADYPIPDFVPRGSDGAITESIYVRELPAGTSEPWIATLRDFSTQLAAALGKQPITTDDSLRPYWCSWTDWHSDNVTDKVIMDNVVEGVKLGIANYIIDDGWFGPGLDSDFAINLNIGDWREDPAKIPDMPSLVTRMRQAGGKPIIWCAPHAVAPHSQAFAQRRPYLLQVKPGVDFLTYNKFHCLCFQSPDARNQMAELCADLVRRYDVDGAKYDLYNCVPSEPCCSMSHSHDTTSAIEGLRRTMEAIASATRALKSDFLIELKQNYATPYLYEHGTVVRAGDTPYNPEGNYLRTAYINAYTPYSLNDYQTITNADSPADAAVMIVKMIAVGPPTYSIDLPALSDEHKRIIAFYHEWYARNLPVLRNWRIPLDADLGTWRADGDGMASIYFLLNGHNRLALDRLAPCQIVNGTFCGELILTLPEPASIKVVFTGPSRPRPLASELQGVDLARIAVMPGDILGILPLR
jgi:hypothetical protein